MSDDLVQRLRDTGPGGGTGAGGSLCRAAADRIEALEAALRRAASHGCDALPHAAGNQCAACIAREALDAKDARLSGRGEGSSEPAPRPNKRPWETWTDV